VVFDKRGSRSSARDRKTVAGVLGGGIFVCGANKRNNQFFDGFKKLCSNQRRNRVF
jgi:hypothetical protein